MGNRTSCRPIRSVIILVINKSDSRCAVVRFCYHSYDYRPNWTPISPITITKIFSPISFKNRAQLITRFNLTDRVISSTVLQALSYYVTPSLLPTHAFTPLKSMIVAMLGAAWIIFSYNVTSNCIFSGIWEWAHQRVLPNVVRSFPLMSYTW